jgi:O-antigen/teichoic acid export membrane protein
MGYFQKAVKGVSWMTALRVLIRALGIVKIAILARILVPSQFGNYGIALLVLGFLEVLTETGINIFLIQEESEIKTYLNSAWVVSILRGILITLTILAISPLIILFFKVPDITGLLYIVAGVAFVRGFINPMEVEFQKKLQFTKEFKLRGFLYLVDAAVAIGIGFAIHSEASMLYGMLAAAVTELVLSFILFKDKPKLRIEKEKVYKVLNSGKWITGAGIFSYVFQNIDNVIIGKVLGTASLGYYQQAYGISTLPVSEIGSIFNKVTFPVYVKIGGDKKRLKAAFLKTLGVIAALVTVFALLILLFSKPIILIFLGERWLVIEPVLKILAVFGALKSILNFSYSLFLSLKLQKYIMYSELMGILGMVAIIYPLTAKYGIVGGGISTIVAFVCSLPVVIYGLRKVFK